MLEVEVLESDTLEMEVLEPNMLQMEILEPNMLEMDIVEPTLLEMEIEEPKEIELEVIGQTPSVVKVDNYEELKNKPSINGVELNGNLTTEDLGIVGTSMTEIELSTDIKNPTEIMNYINKSGTYVAKNAGVIGTNGEPMVVLAKGQFLTISNLQELSSIFGLEVPDNENIVQIDTRLPDGTYRSFQIIGGTRLKEIVWITSENVNDYVDSFNPSDFISSGYGIYTIGGKLAINSASQYDIINGIDNYKPITSNLIAYAVQTKGNNYFAKIKDFNDLQDKVETLETDLTTLKTEIETILESVVTVDE